MLTKHEAAASEGFDAFGVLITAARSMSRSHRLQCLIGGFGQPAGPDATRVLPAMAWIDHNQGLWRLVVQMWGVNRVVLHGTSAAGLRGGGIIEPTIGKHRTEAYTQPVSAKQHHIKCLSHDPQIPP
jgi:hypothetical protein